MIDSSEQNKKEKETQKETIKKGYVAFTQFLLETIVLVGLAIYLGIKLDKKIGTVCLFTIIFTLFMFTVPIYNLVKRMR